MALYAALHAISGKFTFSNGGQRLVLQELFPVILFRIPTHEVEFPKFVSDSYIRINKAGSMKKPQYKELLPVP